MRLMLDNSKYFVFPISSKFRHVISCKDEKWFLDQHYLLNANGAYYHIRRFEFDSETELQEYGLLILLEQ